MAAVEVGRELPSLSLLQLHFGLCPYCSAVANSSDKLLSQQELVAFSRTLCACLRAGASVPAYRVVLEYAANPGLPAAVATEILVCVCDALIGDTASDGCWVRSAAMYCQLSHHLLLASFFMKSLSFLYSTFS